MGIAKNNVTYIITNFLDAMKKLTSIVVYLLAILAAELMIHYAKHFVHIKTGSNNPYINTIIGMLVIVVIFYPIITFSDWLFEKLSASIVHKTKKAVGSNLLGLLISFSIGFAILFLIYLNVWYGVTIW